MYNVVIVDDEIVVRIGMKSIIKWEEYGFKIVGVVADGVMALDIINKEKVDLVITDLKMPNMDGIQLIKEIKKQQYKCKIVVLSNHGEYELVREAMKEGALDYLLKVTIRPEELENLLIGIKHEIDTEEQEKEKIKITVEKNKENEEVVRKSFLLKVINGQIELAEDIDRLKLKYGIGDFEKGIEIFHLRIDNFAKLYEQKIKSKSELVKSINNIVEESLGSNIKHEFIQINHHKFVILLDSNNKNYEDVVKLGEGILKNIKLYLNLTATLVISNEFVGLQYIKSVYEKCDYLNKWRFYLGDGFVLTEGEYGSFKHFNIRHFGLAKDIKNKLQLRNFEEANNLIVEFLYNCRINNYEPKDIKGFLLFILSYIEAYEMENGVLLPDNIEQNKKMIQESEKITEVEEVIDTIFKQIELDLQNCRAGQYRKEVGKIINYINDNIGEKITLKMMAQAVNMNESYLSRMFKNETGKNLIYFINEVKMNKAMELLQKPDYMVKEVAMDVGIDDQFYFNKVFKKFYGISPSEIKRKG